MHIESRYNRNQNPRALLIINDVHLASKPPHTRQDDYQNVVLRKLDSLFKLANEYHAIPLFTGDIFHRAVEPSELIKNTFIDLCNSSEFIPVIIPGNHDMTSGILSRRDSLFTIRSSLCAIVGIDSGVLATATLEYEGEAPVILGIGGTPYGQDIPDNVDWNVEHGVWLTHHNLLFNQHYDREAAIGFKQIDGVNDVFNGHLHHSSPDVRSGETVWHNYGSATRTYLSEADRIPLATIWHTDGNAMTINLHNDQTEHAFSLGKGRTTSSDTSEMIANESSQRFVRFLVGENGGPMDIAQTLDNMHQSGEIDRRLHDFLIEVNETAKMEMGK